MAKRTIPVQDLHGLHTILKRSIAMLEQEAPDAAKVPEIRDVRHGVELLGGGAVAAELAGVTPQSVTSWITTGNFPPDTWELFRHIIEAQGYRCPHRLWRMKEP